MSEKSMFQFKGMRNDIGQKFVPEEYFYESYNVTQDSMAGFDKVKCPTPVCSLGDNNIYTEAELLANIFKDNVSDPANLYLYFFNATTGTTITEFNGSGYDMTLSADASTMSPTGKILNFADGKTWAIADNDDMSFVEYGPELVTNGSFNSDTSEWEANNATMEIVSGGQSGNCIKVTADGNPEGYFHQAINTEAGKKYCLKYYHKNGNYGSLVRVGSYLNGFEVSKYYGYGFDESGNCVNNSENWELKTLYFTAISTTTYISFHVNPWITSGNYSFLDEISVKKVSDKPFSLIWFGEADKNTGFLDKIGEYTLATESVNCRFYQEDLSQIAAYSKIAPSFKGNFGKQGDLSGFHAFFGVSDGLDAFNGKIYKDLIRIDTNDYLDGSYAAMQSTNNPITMWGNQKVSVIAIIKNETLTEIQMNNINNGLGAYQAGELQNAAVAAIDGLFRFNYLNSNNHLVETYLSACNGKLYKNFTSTAVEIYSGMHAGKCQFAILNDKAFIVNGLDYPKIYNGVNIWEMGAPEAVIQPDAGNLNGVYYYAVTYVTDGGEEYLGTVSNTIHPTNKQVLLNLPIGYLGTLSRKIYRTAAGGTQLKLLATINDNTTLTYSDNTLDSSLGSNIIAVNNECPKPKFITVSDTFKLVAVGDASKPTQAFIGTANCEVLDSAFFEDITNRGNDNSPIMGMSEDYGRIVIGSEKQLYFLDVTGDTPVVTITRANIGVLDGYSMVKMPSNSGFAGGVMFVSSDYTVRVLNGNYSDPVPTSLDNLKTENWAQQIRGTLASALSSYSNIHAEYFDYKYHLIVDSRIYVFDTRTLGWNVLEFRTLNNLCVPNVLVNFDNKYLYLGRKNGGYIERMYSDGQYKGEDLPCYVKFPYWVVSEDLKYFKELHIYYLKQNTLKFKVSVSVGDSLNTPSEQSVSEVSVGVFNSQFFNSKIFQVSTKKEDYKTLYLNKYGNWVNFRIDNFNYIRGIRVIYDEIIKE